MRRKGRTMDEIRPDYERDMEIFNGIIAGLATMFGIVVGMVAYWSMV